MQMIKNFKVKAKNAVIFFVVFVLLLCLFISGCSNGGYKYINSITLVSDGNKVFFEAIYYDSYVKLGDITKAEYNASSKENRVDYFAKIKGVGNRIRYKNQLPPKDKMGVTTYLEETATSGKIVYTNHGDASGTYYEKYRYEGIHYSYLQVKKIDSTTIEIKRGSSSTVYSVSSYTIVELK